MTLRLEDEPSNHYAILADVVIVVIVVIVFFFFIQSPAPSCPSLDVDGV